MEPNLTAKPETAAPLVERNNEKRRRPPKSGVKNNRVQVPADGVVTPAPHVQGATGSITAFVPRSVIRNGNSKLNPTAVEFKPSSPSEVNQEAALPNQKRRQRPKSNNRDQIDSPGLNSQDEIGISSQKNQNDSRSRRPKLSGEKRIAQTEEQQSAQSAAEVAASDEEVAELSCPICTDVAPYFAVGKCNHHVCSLCAVRMRVKSKDKHCVICKEDLSVMIVYRPHYHKGGNAEKAASASGDNVLLRPFNSFGLTEADCDLDAGNIPGVRTDPTAGFLFVDCAKHFTEIENLRSMTCPFKQCKARFSTMQTLQRHLKDQHKDVSLCTLCVENRPLFISEHTIMNPKQLVCHMKGEMYVDSSGKGNLPPAGENEHSTGHPACQFCTERFFDSTALYYHMQRSYFTCHLCPRQHMFRYYIDPAALREHHRQEHIVCHICAAVPQLMDSDVAIAFREAREYSDHMRHIHNTQVSGIGIAGNNGGANKTSFRLGASSTYQTNTPGRRDKHGRPLVTVVDLEMGSANPFRNEAEASQQHHGSATNSTSRPVESTAPLIPPHMRIAGRVTGAGRFAAIDSSDLLMQAAAEEYALQAERDARGQKKTMRLSKEQAFPTLSAAYGAGAPAPASAPFVSSWKSRVSAHANGSGLMDSETEGSSSATDSTGREKSAMFGKSPGSQLNELHPMSLLHSSKQQAKDLQRRKDAEEAEKVRLEKQRLEDKRIERNLSLASALLGGSGKTVDAGGSPHLSLTAADVGATLKNRSYINSLVAPLQQLGWSESELMRTIYPPVLVNWAKLHMLELAKIEKKLYTLLTDPQLNSVQLKPMARGMRTVVHQLSRMYLLNSYEFDPEPNRYVSVVKQVDSYLPSCVLSRAAALPMYTLPGENGTQLPEVPVIFLSLSSEAFSAGLVNTNSSVSSAGKKTPCSLATSSAEPVRIAFTTAEVVSRVNDLLNSADLWRSWYKHVIDNADLELIKAQNQSQLELPLPPPPPGISTSESSPALTLGKQASKPRALSDLPVPRITGLVAAGASSVGLRFADRVSSQLAALFLEYCVALHFTSSGINSKMGARVQGSATKFDMPLLSAKQVQELTVLSVFHFTPAFTTCTVADIVFNSNVPLGSVGRPAESAETVKSAALDRRHYMSAEESWTTISKGSGKATAAISIGASDGYAAKKLMAGDDGWQYQAVKTKLYDDSAPSLLAVPLQDSWEDLEQFAEFNQSATAATGAGIEEEPQKREEWETFLQDKRAKAEASGSMPRYQPKRSDSSASGAKYVPPSARAKSGEKAGAEDNRKVSADGLAATEAEVEGADGDGVVVGQALEDGYDLCGEENEVGVTAEDDFADEAVTGEVFATDYLESEADFEEYLRRLQIEHEREQQGGHSGRAKPAGAKRQGQSSNRAAASEVRAVPVNALLSGAHGASASAVHAVAAVAVPISDDISDEEAARAVLKKQLQREQSASKYNKFGVLDEDDVDA